LLAGLFVAQLLLTVSFLDYIHTTGGSTSGDYGIVYRLEERFRLQTADYFRIPQQTVTWSVERGTGNAER
jgi:hypothetical protein